MIGQSPPRPDGLAKATGELRYGDDFTLPGMWYGATIRSPYPHARIDAIGWKDGAPPAGVVRVIAADLTARNGVKLIDDSWPALADGVVRHVGEAVALVAAPTREGARRAADRLEVGYTPLDPVLDLEDPAGPPPLYALDLGCGDVDAAMAAADRVVEGTYRTGHQEHIYIECQAMTAWFEPDGTLSVAGSMQCPYYVHKSLAWAFDVPGGNVRVQATGVGGGFGGKEDYPSLIALHAAALAQACGRPVRLAYDRHEDIVGTTKRHPSIVRHRTGVAADGRLLAMDIEVILDGGAYLTLSPVVLSRAILHATGAYRCPSVRVAGRVLRTHTPPNGAFRGFGVPQTIFAVERQMDRVGRALGLDPYEIRLRNVVGPGDRLATGQVLDETTAARQCLEAVEARTRFRERWRAAEDRRVRGPAEAGPCKGVGLSLYFHGAGFTGSGEQRMKSPVTVRLLDDGRLEVLTAMTDMGQGCAIVFPQIAAAAAGATMDDFVFPPPDTAVVPDSGPTVASRTTMIVGGTIDRAVRQIRQQIVEWWTRRHPAGEAPFRDMARRYRAEAGPLDVTLRHEPPAWQAFDDQTYQGAAYPTYAWGADVADVEVDRDTLQTRATRATVVCDVGRAIHPVLCAGQIEGGTLQAIGYGLMEEMKVENGRYLNDRLATYIIPTFKDSPVIDVVLLEHPWEGGPFGAKGIGELPMDGAAPAVVQAIENATGIVPTEIPATPERLQRWMRQNQVAGRPNP
jgi:CO/xanthine dehydrogenase Mo-binding subunit